ncbi:MAG: GerMN domain-containing protein [Clostridia bacterium]|nr:GerMN domain-containing protein [Clostridia bacterium]
MKRNLLVFFIILLLGIAYFFISGNGITYEISSDITDISPYSKDYTRLTKLYFIENNELVSESRTITVKRLDVEYAAVKALKTGSKLETQESPIGSDVSIISVITTDRICYVNLGSEFLTDDDQKLFLKVMAIVNTVTEIESIDYVQVLVDGKKITSANGRMSSPMTKNTSYVQEQELQHKDIAKKFMDYIAQNRYDLAFDMIDSESKMEMTFRDFKESALLINNDIKGYTQSYAFAKREQGRFIIQVKYVLRDTPGNDNLVIDPNMREEFYYSWPMIKEDNIWKIKYYDL